MLPQQFAINWQCRHTWRRASYNTMWCLIGCSIGDFGTIAFFQFTGIPWPVLMIMTPGDHQRADHLYYSGNTYPQPSDDPEACLQNSHGMSLISMISMEAAMNITDVMLTGGAMLTWWVIPFMLFAVFITPLPYNTGG